MNPIRSIAAALRALLAVPRDLWMLIVTYLPGETGVRLRRWFWRGRLRRLGKGVRIDPGVTFGNPKFISIDDNCWIDRDVVLLAGLDRSERERTVVENKGFTGEPGVISIGRNVHVGMGCLVSGISAGVAIADNCCLTAHCKVYAWSHHYRMKSDPANRECHFGTMGPRDRQCLIEGPVQIGPNTGIAVNSVVLPGVHIPEDCFVSVGSVVRPGRFPANSILAGNPAVRVGDRFRAPEEDAAPEPEDSARGDDRAP